MRRLENKPEKGATRPRPIENSDGYRAGNQPVNSAYVCSRRTNPVSIPGKLDGEREADGECSTRLGPVRTARGTGTRGLPVLPARNNIGNADKKSTVRLRGKVGRSEGTQEGRGKLKIAQTDSSYGNAPRYCRPGIISSGFEEWTRTPRGGGGGSAA